jgi:hypothetical protein
MMIRAAASQCACGDCRQPSNGAPELGSTVAAARLLRCLSRWPPKSGAKNQIYGAQ